MRKQEIFSLILLFSCASFDLRAQGTFQNLNFESAQIPPNTPPGSLPISQALPGWSGYIGGNPVTTVDYNSIGLGIADIILEGPGSLEPVLQGQYSVAFESSPFVTTAISQVGTIPGSAQSIQYEAFSPFVLSFAGHAIPSYVVGSGSLSVYPYSYSILRGDVSSFAGQTGLLLFQGGGEIDGISFSSNPIPEPGTCTLLLGGSALFALARWKRLV